MIVTIHFVRSKWRYYLYSPETMNYFDQNMTMPSGLIDKLFMAGIVDKQIDHLAFSDFFCQFMDSYAKNRSSSLEDWRDMLGHFKQPLSSLSDDEISATIVLLNYYFDKTTK